MPIRCHTIHSEFHTHTQWIQFYYVLNVTATKDEQLIKNDEFEIFGRDCEWASISATVRARVFFAKKKFNKQTEDKCSDQIITHFAAMHVCLYKHKSHHKQIITIITIKIRKINEIIVRNYSLYFNAMTDL